MSDTPEQPRQSPPSVPAGAIQFGSHIMAFVDLLGQSATLSKWNFVPKTPEDRKRWEEAASDSMGRVMRWREQFEKTFIFFLSQLNKTEVEAAKMLPESVRWEFDRLRETSLRKSHFSDTMIYYSPLQNQHGHYQTSNVLAMFTTCGSLMLAALTEGTVFRGAIEIGILGHFVEGDPYGPVMLDAHHLESKVAQYPRLVVGPGVMNYLDAINRQTGTHFAIQATKAGAQECRRYLTQDEDGKWIVDYLGQAIATVGGNEDRFRRSQAKAFEFVVQELGRFRTSKTTTLIERYERLEAYFKSRGSK